VPRGDRFHHRLIDLEGAHLAGSASTQICGRV
jgi:hypothetical protein